MNKVEQDYKSYCEYEYEDVVEALAKYDWMTNEQAVASAIDRCIGAAIFARRLGASDKITAVIFAEAEKALKSLLTKEG